MVQISDITRECIDACTECANVCAETIAYCMQQGGRHVEAAHLTLMIDCAQICRNSADFMARGSSFADSICEMCAEICQRCADDCASFGDDQQMQRCAETCRRCADSCRRMAAA